eukprot:evm.model.scf_543EXC.5 EVM.evm.TU.scf_543EXC.5   scf_543EXC:25787-36119(+)
MQTLCSPKQATKKMQHAHTAPMLPGSLLCGEEQGVGCAVAEFRASMKQVGNQAVEGQQLGCNHNDVDAATAGAAEHIALTTELEAQRKHMNQLRCCHIAELEDREQRAADRIASQRHGLERLAYEHRQRILREEEHIKKRREDLEGELKTRQEAIRLHEQQVLERERRILLQEQELNRRWVESGRSQGQSCLGVRHKVEEELVHQLDQVAADKVQLEKARMQLQHVASQEKAQLLACKEQLHEAEAMLEAEHAKAATLASNEVPLVKQVDGLRQEVARLNCELAVAVTGATIQTPEQRASTLPHECSSPAPHGGDCHVHALTLEIRQHRAAVKKLQSTVKKLERAKCRLADDLEAAEDRGCYWKGRAEETEALLDEAIEARGGAVQRVEELGVKLCHAERDASEARVRLERVSQELSVLKRSETRRAPPAADNRREGVPAPTLAHTVANLHLPWQLPSMNKVCAISPPRSSLLSTAPGNDAFTQPGRAARNLCEVSDFWPYRVDQLNREEEGLALQLKEFKRRVEAGRRASSRDIARLKRRTQKLRRRAGRSPTRPGGGRPEFLTDTNAPSSPSSVMTEDSPLVACAHWPVASPCRPVPLDLTNAIKHAAQRPGRHDGVGATAQPHPDVPAAVDDPGRHSAELRSHQVECARDGVPNGAMLEVAPGPVSSCQGQVMPTLRHSADLAHDQSPNDTPDSGQETQTMVASGQSPVVRIHMVTLPSAHTAPDVVGAVECAAIAPISAAEGDGHGRSCEEDAKMVRHASTSVRAQHGGTTEHSTRLPLQENPLLVTKLEAPSQRNVTAKEEHIAANSETQTRGTEPGTVEASSPQNCWGFNCGEAIEDVSTAAREAHLEQEGQVSVEREGLPHSRTTGSYFPNLGDPQALLAPLGTRGLSASNGLNGASAPHSIRAEELDPGQETPCHGTPPQLPGSERDTLGPMWDSAWRGPAIRKAEHPAADSNLAGSSKVCSDPPLDADWFSDGSQVCPVEATRGEPTQCDPANMAGESKDDLKEAGNKAQVVCTAPPILTAPAVHEAQEAVHCNSGDDADLRSVARTSSAMSEPTIEESGEGSSTGSLSATAERGGSSSGSSLPPELGSTGAVSVGSISGDGMTQMEIEGGDADF